MKCAAFFGAYELLSLTIIEGLGSTVLAAAGAVTGGLLAWSLVGLRPRPDARPDRATLGPVLVEAIAGLENTARRQGVALTLEAAQPGPLVHADRDWLRQVVEGLVDNALRHGAPLTRITVAAEAVTGIEIEGSTGRLRLEREAAPAG